MRCHIPCEIAQSFNCHSRLQEIFFPLYSDDSALPDEMGSGESEGSGEDDGCGCRFGAVCDDTTIDDEDSKCVCLLRCTKCVYNLIITWGMRIWIT